MNADLHELLGFSISATGGSGSYQFYDFFVNGTLAQSSSSSLTFNYQVNGAVTYYVNASVTDSLGAHASSSTVTVVVHPPLSATFSVRSLSIDLGNSEIGSAWGVNGTPPYFTGLTGCPVVPANRSQCWLNGTSTGSFVVTATVSDQAGSSRSISDTISVNPPPKVWLNASAASIGTGKADDLSAARKGGGAIAGVGYPMAWRGCPPGELVGAYNTSCTFNVTTPGIYPVRVWYNDSFNSTSAEVNVTVLPPPSATILAEYDAMDVGVQDQLTAQVSGGVAPYSYAWSGGGGCVPWNGQACNITGILVGPTTVNVSVSDASHQSAKATVTLQVNAPPTLSIQLPAAVDANKSVNVTLLASGGTGTLAVAFPSGCAPLNATACSWTAPAAVGMVILSANVTDAFMTRTFHASTSVFWRPHIGWLGGRTLLEVGMNTTLTTWVGFYPQPQEKDVGFYLNGTLVQNSSSASYKLAPLGSGSFVVIAVEEDVFGEFATTGPLTVGVRSPLQITINGRPSLAVDERGSYQAVVDGGIAPFTFLWEVTGPYGSQYAGGNATFWWRTAGDFEVNLTVSDSVGRSRSTGFDVTVCPSACGTASGTGVSTLTYALLGLTVTGLTFLAVVLVLLKRKKGKERHSPEKAEEADSGTKGENTPRPRPKGGSGTIPKKPSVAAAENNPPASGKKDDDPERPTQGDSTVSPSPSSPSSAGRGGEGA